jgi:hypothetical protein
MDRALIRRHNLYGSEGGCGAVPTVQICRLCVVYAGQAAKHRQPGKPKGVSMKMRW